MPDLTDDYLERALSAAFARNHEGDPHDVAAGVAPRALVWRMPDRVGRYPIESLVGRGGIGVVLKARDTELDRAIAIKVLHEHLSDDPDIVLRFIDEARVGGQLEHPGVVPVHEMGRTDDGLPFFTMKLVEGETLAMRLAQRKSPADDQIYFLGAFEKVCQIVAYAHEQRIVHLDIKPANVLVGAFGEILLTDWGFASSLPLGCTGIEGSALNDDPSRVRIVGTPAYMSPEQARGDIEKLDARSDVFALGAVLCEILSGRPPYGGDSSSETLLAASRAWQDEALARLDACAADKDLIALAKRCISPSSDDRPPNAGSVASAMEAYIRSLDERARAAAVEAEKAKTLAAAEVRRRRLLAVLAVVIVATVLTASFAWLGIERVRAERVRENDRLLTEMVERVRILIERASAAKDPEPALWDEPHATIRRARELASERDVAPDLSARIEKLAGEVDRDRAEVIRNAGLVEALAAIAERYGDYRDANQRDKDYGSVFRSAGIDIEKDGAEIVGKMIDGHPIRAHLVAALDEWTLSRRASAGVDAAAVLVKTANLVDREPWRTRVRTAAASDPSALDSLAQSPEVESQSPEILVLLARGLRRAGKAETAINVLERAQRRHPENYGIHHELGTIYRESSPPNLDEAIRQFSMALAVRPRSAHAIVDLAQVFLQSGKLDRAEKYLDEAYRVDDKYAPATHYRGVVAMQRRDLSAAEKLLRDALLLDPRSISTNVALGIVLRSSGRFSESADALRRAAEIDSKNPDTWLTISQVLVKSGRFAEAMDAFEKARESSMARGRPFSESADAYIESLKRFESAAKALDAPLPPDAAREDFLVRGMAAAYVSRFGEAFEALEAFFRASNDRSDYPVDLLVLAARSAVGSIGGRGVDPTARRAKALEWVRAAVETVENSDPPAASRSLVAETLELFVFDAAFAPVREPTFAADVGEKERAEWSRVLKDLREIAADLRAD